MTKVITTNLKILVYIPRSWSLSFQVSSKASGDQVIINQYGLRDNIANDKVIGDKISTQISNKQSLVEAAQQIKALLDQLDQDYDCTTAVGQMNIATKVVEAIEK